MPTIVELPVLYVVHGVPVGKRKPGTVRMIEPVPFVVGDLTSSVEEFDFFGRPGWISEDRSWLPLRGPYTAEAALETTLARHAALHGMHEIDASALRSMAV